MSGICGILSLNGQQPDQDMLNRMVQALRHRGPDGSEILVDGPCGLGHARLATVNLSDAAHQPMVVECGTAPNAQISEEVWGSCDGEVYNFHDIQAALQAMEHQFQSNSSVETLLRAYVQFGAEHFIKSFRGMFALAIWDVSNQTLTLLRDRLGQKPLFYTIADDQLIFASEVKAILEHPAVTPRLNEALLPHYLAYGYPPTTYTMFEGIQALAPGHMLTVDLRGGTDLQIRAYWKAAFPAPGPDDRSEEDIEAELLAHLRWATQIRMKAEVPLGALLSGGLDLTAIVALMVEANPGKINTFSIGFANDDAVTNVALARRVAAHFVTNHHEFVIEPDVVNLVQELVWYYDQPFGNSTAILTYLIGKLTQPHANVVLTGDGGDELFAGYDHFRAAQLADTYAQIMPDAAQRMVASALDRLPESPGYRNIMRRASRIMQSAQLPLAERHLSWVRYVPAQWLKTLAGIEQERLVQQHYREFFGDPVPDGSPAMLAQLLDVTLHTYLPDDMLVRVDRCNMGASLETRTPFLDHHLVQFAIGLPNNLKLRRGTSKYILKQALRDYLPARIAERKKHGFAVPVNDWFREELGKYAHSVLIDGQAVERGILNPDALQEMFSIHSSRRDDLGKALWTLLTLELWLQRYF